MASLRAGTAQIDITPSLGCHIVGYFDDRVADHIHDPLAVRALVLDDGTTILGLVVCDIIALTDEVVTAARVRIQALTGVPPENVLISATHTHTGPAIVGALGTPTEEGYGEAIAPRLADAFVMAFRQRQPAQLARAGGDVAAEVHNRRWHMKDGSVRMNPGYQHPDRVRPAGPTDPQLGLLIVRTPQRQPLAVFANLGLHYVGSPQGTWISADYFAAFGRALQRCAGAGFTTILANGCQGDINNCDFTRPAPASVHPYHQIERVANVVAAEAWKAWNLLREEDFASEVTLGVKQAMVPFHARTPTADELATARRVNAGEPKPTDMEWIYAQELLKTAAAPAVWDVPIQALRIGDLGLVGLPGEVFCQVGLDIKRRSPFAQTMVVGIANGTIGYVATDQALSEGSYETRLCRHVRAPTGTAPLWTDTAVRLLQDLH